MGNCAPLVREALLAALREHESRPMRAPMTDWRGRAERRVRLLRDLAAEGSARCCYAPGALSPEAWITATCDCKYVGGPLNALHAPGSEVTGCCEMRAAYLIMADGESAGDD